MICMYVLYICSMSVCLCVVDISSYTPCSQLQNQDLHLNPRQTIAEVGDREVDQFLHHIDRRVSVQLSTQEIATLPNLRT